MEVEHMEDNMKCKNMGIKKRKDTAMKEKEHVLLDEVPAAGSDVENCFTEWMKAEFLRKINAELHLELTTVREPKEYWTLHGNFEKLANELEKVFKIPLRDFNEFKEYVLLELEEYYD